MDLIPILTRAESLFRRFERTVQAIDKKNNFPIPSTAHQRKPTTQTGSDNNGNGNGKGKLPQRPQGTSSGVSAGPSGTGTGIGTAPSPLNADGTDTRVISPELRMLLRRDIPWSRSQQSGSA